MNRFIKALAVVSILGIVAAACGGDGATNNPTSTGAPSVQVQKGGTFKTQIVSDVSAAFDPQKEYYALTFALFRCCLLRTLLSTNGEGAEQGGNVLHPDLAASLPTVSDDDLTWTFTLKDGITYAPPLQDVTVTSADFVRALEREACSDCATGGYSFYYSAIKGFDDFSAGDADSISGLATPDDKTLTVELTAPAGDLGYRFALPATAPIPPNPGDANAALGVATGHTQDYGRFLATTGPYMFQGQDQLDYSVDPKDQKPISGYAPGKSITLIRNPSWSESTDDLRPAYLDQIDIAIGGTPEDVANKVDNGDLDLGLDSTPPPEQLQRYLADPQKKDLVNSNFADGVRYISFNLAIPPFDDVHVRKAVNFAIDKDGLRRLRGGPTVGKIASHTIVDTLLTTSDGTDLLAGYDPYATPNGAGDVNKAMEEMKQSKYDTDGDGVCDDPSCTDILTVIDEADPYPDQTSLIGENVKPLGMTLNVKPFERTTMYQKCNDPAQKVALCPSPGWFKDYPDAYTWSPLFDSSGIFPSCCNYSLLGASSDLLSKAEYAVTTVPSVDEDVKACGPLTDDERITCWANFDKKIMEEIVPWIPYLFDNNVDIAGARIVNYTYDSFSGTASLDHIGLVNGGA